MTDKKDSTTNEQSDSVVQASHTPDDKVSEQNSTAHTQKKTAVEEPISNTKKPIKSTANMTDKSPHKISKIALLSLFIAISAAAGVGGLHFWQTQQQQLLEQRLSTQSSLNATNTKQQITQLVTQSLTQQQTNLAQQLQSVLRQFEENNKTKISELESTIERLSQNQPSDWLIHEAEYLIRIASRTIWLEQDTKAAINLLADADNRLQELNDPEYLSIRQFIHDDIESLKLMPTLRTEEVVLTLMSLSKQINVLPLAMQVIPESLKTEEKLELSDNINDWRDNLAKTIKKLLNTFVVVHSREGNIEPLLSPSHQQNLRQNLVLKLQLAQWAASEGNAKLYSQTLNDIQAWLVNYFDMNALSNQKFIENIDTIKNELIAFDYPNSLSSLKAIRKVLTKNTNNRVTNKSKSDKPPLTSPELPKNTEVEVKSPEKNNKPISVPVADKNASEGA